MITSDTLDNCDLTNCTATNLVVRDILTTPTTIIITTDTQILVDGEIYLIEDIMAKLKLLDKLITQNLPEELI